MRFRSKGRYAYAVNTPPIYWKNTPPPAGTQVYCLAWSAGQHSLMASSVITQKEETK